MPIAADDIAGLVKFVQQNSIDLTVVGPEAPLVAGIVDVFQREKLRVFGPSKAAAQLEGSKVFCKNVLHGADVPTADYRVFRDADSATRYVMDRYPSDDESVPLVVKADGLAAGKGVIVCSTRRDALAAIDRIARQREFGDGRQAARHRGAAGRPGSRACWRSPTAARSSRCRRPRTTRRPTTATRPEHRRHGGLLPDAAGR